MQSMMIFYIATLLLVATPTAQSSDGVVQCDKDQHCFKEGDQPTMTNQKWKRLFGFIKNLSKKTKT